jgi:hypothetical protein
MSVEEDRKELFIERCRDFVRGLPREDVIRLWVCLNTLYTDDDPEVPAPNRVLPETVEQFTHLASGGKL